MKSLDILICLGGVSLTNAINSLRPRGSCAFTYAVTWGSASTNFCCDVRADMCQLESDGTTYTRIVSTQSAVTLPRKRANLIRSVILLASPPPPRQPVPTINSVARLTSAVNLVRNNACPTPLLRWVGNARQSTLDEILVPTVKPELKGTIYVVVPTADHYVENGTPHCGRRPDDNTPTTPNTGGGSPAPGGNNQVTPSRSASASATRAASNEALRGSGLNKVGEITMLGLLAMLLVV
ncbi:hypothetical protein M408DRAFT_26870 [Serendipita vermifera MAFF 305830]|uniref:Uncharacterized protein n=1 Tax=Serendipita vermifera MAFF 305830 TaxID=933852 RepID=A0A0C3AIY0_SERVB|nr:hypothetical protein M408DRAFT_26870 [Serendipita vermifera MAFF 305830]